MEIFYSEILDESLKNLDHIHTIITPTAHKSVMKSGEIIDEAASRIEKNYKQLLSFNERNANISIERSNSLEEIEAMKSYYGID